MKYGLGFLMKYGLGFLLLSLACDSGGVAIATREPRVELSPAAPEVIVGESVSLQAVVRDTQGRPVSGAQITWSSSTPSVATVSNAGVVTGVSTGTARITAASNGASAYADVTVVPAAPEGPVVQVYPQVQYQQMTGWEGVAQIGEVECNRQAFSNYRLPLIDRLVNELGINRVRLELPSGAENPTDWYARLLAGDTQGWRAHRYEIVNDNTDPNSLNAQGFHFTMLDYLVDSLIQPLRSRLAGRGEKLYVNLTYVDFESSPFEHSSNPEEYAEVILAAFRHLQSKYGFVPDAVEVILEPDNTSNWRAATIGAAIKAAGDRLKAAGFTPAFIAPSTANASEAVTYFDQMINLPGVRDYLGELSYHRYAGVSESVLSAIRSRATQYGIRAAMLEHIGSGVADLHKDLIDGRNSAWQQFALAFCVGDNGGSYYLIDQSNPASPVISLASHSRYFRQYFAFVRLGATRIGAASGDSRFDPIAFRNTNGKVVLVVRATGGGTFTVKVPPGTYGVTWTTSSQSFVSGADVLVSTSGGTVNMPAAGVITLFQR